MVWLDGENLGHQPLYATYGSNAVVEYVTPFLKRGKHTVTVFWDDAASFSSLRLKEVRLEQIGGPDSNGNGITDWVEAMLAAESGLDTNAVLSSYVSPLCLEGRDPYLSLMDLKVEQSGGLVAWPVQQNAGQRWYANMPLQTNGGTTVKVSYQNHAVVERHVLSWQPFNVLTSGVPALTIRKGDSLLLTVRPSGQPQGNVLVTVSNALQGVVQYTTTTRDPAPFQFINGGDYTVTATYSPNNGAPVSGGLAVKVVDYSFPENPVCWGGKARDWALTNVPPELVWESDPRLQLSTQTNQTLSLLIDQNEPRTLVGRLGTHGPIVTSVRADGLRLFGTPDTYNTVIERYPDHSRLVETMEVLSPVLTNVTVQINIIVGGVTFDDGTTYRELQASDFDALGQHALRFLMPQGVQTANCHRVTIVQGAAKVGTY
jgi:hypothetical protein